VLSGAIYNLKYGAWRRLLDQVKDGYVIINSAIDADGGCPGRATSVDLYPDCGVPGEPMEKFIRGFIKE
jgi:hypothetical protein